MPGLPLERDEVARQADRAADRRGEAAGVQEDRPLLDVQLDGGQRAVEARGRAGRGVEVHAARGEGVLQAGALAVEEIADVVGIEGAGGGRGAEEAAAEARALLVGPVDEADLDRRRRVRGGQRAHDAERGEEAERAVEPAAGRDRVDVRPDDDEALRRAVARQRGPDVPRRVALDGDRQVLELREQPVARGLPVRRPREAPRAVGPAEALVQLAEVGEDAVDVDRERHAGTAGRDTDRAT